MNARIANLCEFFNSTPIDRLNKKLINKYIERRREKVVDGTIQVELNALFASINSELSNSRRYDVIRNSRGHWSLDTKKRRKESLSYQQFEAIHEKLEESDQKNHTHFALFMEILRETGLRWGQLKEQRFIDIQGLFDPDNQAELKKGGITLSMKKLDALKCPHDIGTKFTIEVNQKTKKIVLSAAQ